MEPTGGIKKSLVLAIGIFVISGMAFLNRTSPGGPSKHQDSLEELSVISISGPVDAQASSLKLDLGRGHSGWARQLEGSRPLATPAISDGVLYIGGGFGSFDLYALEASTGALKWRVRTTDDGPTAVLVHSANIILNTESCTLEIRRKEDGSLVWGRWLGDPLMSQPAVASGRVVACFPQAENAVAASEASGPVLRGQVVQGGVPVQGRASHALAAFDLATGAVEWAHGIPADCISAPVIEAGTAYAATFDGSVTLVDLATGRLVAQEQRNATSAPWVARKGAAWETLMSQKESREETVAGEKVQVSFEGLRRMDSRGNLSEEKQAFVPASYLDRETVDGSAYFTPEMKGVADSAVGFTVPPAAAALGYAATNVGVSRVVDAWSFQGSRPAVVGGRLFNTQGNKVTGGAQDGRKVDWEFTYRPKTEERLLSPPAAVKGQLVFTALDGSVFSLDTKTGEIRHAWRFDKKIVSQPAVMGGRIFVGTIDGWLISIDTQDGDLDGWSMWGGGPAHNGL